MREPKELLKEASYWLAFSYLLINGLFFVLLSLKLLSGELLGIEVREGAQQVVFGVWGLLSFSVLAYIIRRLMRHYRSQTRISSPGPQGTIWISPQALKEFVLKSLEEKLGLSESKVSLEISGEGVAIQIRTAVPLSKTITDLGKEIQELIKSDVEAKIGVEVSKVEVFAASISSDDSQNQNEGEYTPLEMPERGSND